MKPAEKTAQSDSRILFLHVGDAPKPAQAPKANAALDYTPQHSLARRRPMDQRQTFTMRWPKSSSATAQQNLRQRNRRLPSRKQRVLRYSLTINGLWGRKRTPDFHSVTLASRVDPKQPWPLDKLLTMMRNKVAELRVKPGAKLKLLETDVDITPDGFERITLLADRTLHTETLS